MQALGDKLYIVEDGTAKLYIFDLANNALKTAEKKKLLG